MSHVILFRRIDKDEEEIAVAKQFFPVVEKRSLIKENELVIGRFSVLPFYKELEEDLPIGSKLVNSYVQHKYIADLNNWYQDIKDYTPKTWFSLMDFKLDSSWNGPVILKGLTNSRKFLWKTHMYAETTKDVENVYCRLMDDSMIGEQGVCIRQFIPFVNYGVDMHGMPISKEFRIFVLNKKVVAKGFYWSNHIDELSEKPNPEDIPIDFIQHMIQLIGDSANFYTIDVAQDINGKWWVVELNDGQMAGLSNIDNVEFYSNLQKVLNETHYQNR